MSAIVDKHIGPFPTSMQSAAFSLRVPGGGALVCRSLRAHSQAVTVTVEAIAYAQFDAL